MDPTTGRWDDHCIYLNEKVMGISDVNALNDSYITTHLVRDVTLDKHVFLQ